MSPSYSPGLAPFRGRELRTYLESKHGAEFVRQTGSHVFLRLPNGAIVRAPDTTDVVTVLALRENARVLNMSYPDLMADMGYPVGNAGRIKRGLTKKPAPDRSVGKGEVIRLIDDLASHVDRQRSSCAAGIRDKAFYRRVYDALVPVRSAFARAERELGEP